LILNFRKRGQQYIRARPRPDIALPSSTGGQSGDHVEETEPARSVSSFYAASHSLTPIETVRDGAEQGGWLFPSAQSRGPHPGLPQTISTIGDHSGSASCGVATPSTQVAVDAAGPVKLLLRLIWMKDAARRSTQSEGADVAVRSS
jgi:hypothetical protein